ncbi:MAG: acyl-CoA dehydrogenase [Saprospiraceae bacterium]|jgi:acyl-CoA dehydrogenase
MSIELFRTEVRAFLEESCPVSMRQPAVKESDTFFGGRNASFSSEDQETWFHAMADKGWTTPTWPKKYGGGGLTQEEGQILKKEMAALGCRLPLLSFGIWMLGPALLQFGSEEQREKYLPDIIKGKIWWCQGYSEPGAGSDLAGLQTTAVSDGDDYIVNGQKVWTSYADKSDKIFALVRTDQGAKKQIGITFLLIDMDAPGVSTSPIKLISGKSPFCETFFDNVRVPKANVVGEENIGWTVAKYLLTHERSAISSAVDGDVLTPLSYYAKKSLGTDANGKIADPILRADIAAWEIDAAGFKLTLDRINEEMKSGQPIGAKSSFMKYYGSELNKKKYELRLECEGRDALAWDGEQYQDGKIARQFCRTKGNSIEGGTSEIQLNIISKHILGLPSK